MALDAADQTLLTGAGAVLLGAREHTTIPAYLKNADVLVVPHVVTEFTDSLDPIKVYEYLAAARPVVSTPVAGFRELEVDHVAVVPAGDFVARTRSTSSRPRRPPTARPAVPSWDDPRRGDASRARRGGDLVTVHHVFPYDPGHLGLTLEQWWRGQLLRWPLAAVARSRSAADTVVHVIADRSAHSPGPAAPLR